jgi:putative DNA primase/helicase
MTAQLKSWAAALGGEICGKGVVCPGPGHSRRDRSLSVTVSTAAPDGFVVHSFAGDDAIECRDHVRRRLGLPEFRQGRPQKPPLGGKGGPASYRDRSEPKRAAGGLPKDDSYNHKLAMAIWAEGHDPRGTLVEAYLRNRRLELPYEAANEAIRFHPSCLFSSERFPAMVCLVRNIVTNEPQGVHRTALMPDGTAVKRNGKTFRMTLGPMANGAIKLDPDENVLHSICIGEGVETCLSGRQLGLQPIWSVISVGGIERFPVLPGVDCIRVLRENDRASAKAVETCARRWFEAGREVIIVAPDTAKDLNDELLAVIQ